MSKKRWNVELKAITPIHVGGGHQMDPTEYIAKKGYIYYLNQTTYVADLLAKGNTALASALDAANLEHICKILSDAFNPEIKRHWHSRVPVSEVFCKLWYQELNNRNSTLTLHRFIRNTAQDAPMLPGSSIKGSLRTALLDSLARNDEMQKKITPLKHRKEFEGQAAEAILLTCQNKRGGMDVAADPFKYLKVSDATIDSTQILVDKLKRFGMAEKELGVYYEFLAPNQTCSFTIEADERFELAANHLVKQLNVFYKKLITKEWNWLKDNLKRDGWPAQNVLTEISKSSVTTQGLAVIKLGFGTGGWGLSLSPWRKDTVKTKWLWKNHPLGWAQLRFEEL
jgi:CRISPR type III-A-associated RAMP protein Csm5